MSTPRITMKPAYLDRSAVAEYVSLGVTTMERMVARGDFPGPRHLVGNRVGWLVREIDEWAEARPASEQLPPAGSGYGRAGKAA